MCKWLIPLFLYNRIHDGEETINIYKVSLIINCICCFNCLRAVILIKTTQHHPASMILKDSIEQIRSSLPNINDRKLLNDCKINLISSIYNHCVLLYMQAQMKEWVSSLRKLTEMITKDIILVSDEILK